MHRIVSVFPGLILYLALSTAESCAAQQANPGPVPNRDAEAARVNAIELDTPYVPPPGDPLAFHAAGLVQVECSAVFVSGFAPGFASRNIGYFVSPLAEREKLGPPQVDRRQQTVSVTLPNGKVRTAKYVGDQGCVTLPEGSSDPNFKPVAVAKRSPNRKLPWPEGDGLEIPDRIPGVDLQAVAAAVDAAFDQDGGSTAAFLITWRGRIIGERYASGVTPDTPLEGWSMGKSITATLMGILIQQGVYDLWQPAPIPEWSQPDDMRSKIRIADLLRMSSGLRIRAPLDLGYTPSSYPDHIYFYTGAIDSFHYAATRPQQWPPNTVGRYRNTDPVLVNYLVRLGAKKLGQEYLSFPQRALFDKLGIRTMVLETDPFGNFLTNGYELGAARDWARLANLYLRDGLWNDERLLPKGFVDFVRTPAPAWVIDNRPAYGGFFWLNKRQRFDIPDDAYFMIGVGGQYTIIIPTHDLVIVRMGYDAGESAGVAALRRALSLVMKAIPVKASSKE